MDFGKRYRKSVIECGYDLMRHMSKLEGHRKWFMIRDRSIGFYFIFKVANEYRIPPAFQELMQIKEITKLHASSIIIELSKYPVDWYDGIIIRSFNGTPWSDAVCYKCATYNIFCGKWINNSKTTLCMGCYASCPESGYRYTNMQDFNVMDWVEFYSEGESNINLFTIMLVNCNTKSKDYGKIMVGVCNNLGGNDFYVVGDTEAFMGYVCKWMDVQGVQRGDANDFLDSPCTDITAMSSAVRHNVFPGQMNITNRMILSNTHLLICDHPDDISDLLQIVDDETKILMQNYHRATMKEPIFPAYVARYIYTNMDRYQMYTDLEATFFPVWLFRQVSRNV